MPTKPLRSPLPPVAGIGLRGPHMPQILKQRPSAGWLEVHAENYMHPSPATAALEQLCRHYTLSIHGVGLSLGSAQGVDTAHLARLKSVCDRFQPAMVSEHLAWCVGDGIYLNDLMPLPHDEEALAIVCRNIDQTQEVIGRRILIENLSAYIGFARSTMAEPEFLSEIARRTGCGLLLDINNVHISARNLGFDAQAYIARLPGDSIEEIHLAGHATNDTPDGPVLIDNHGSAVAPAVWSLYRFALERIGTRPTLIEWDSDIPPLATLLGEAMWADLLAETVANAKPSVLPFLPPSRSKIAKVGICDHHPSRTYQPLELAHA
ncbi:DUF692 domain-containing protein [Nordella sp. HKS 07]|uniref:MNIO family bufferin maturase n=1 Tax=Nordella sp. HKS 07 TaxID=2712222 RepID=UPI0013E193EB|nr:DUF692 domain-containing protein [Nordella sp. HKS 07]QIG51518.1 DUF692 domain-containing protein [Nordella sp. HKS 07]